MAALLGEALQLEEEVEVAVVEDASAPAARNERPSEATKRTESCWLRRPNPRAGAEKRGLFNGLLNLLHIGASDSRRILDGSVTDSLRPKQPS